jgi:hypothetical protein
MKLKKAPANIDSWFQLAQAHLSAGHTNDVFAALGRGVAAIPSGGVSSYAQRAGVFFENSTLTAVAVDRVEKTPNHGWSTPSSTR